MQSGLWSRDWQVLPNIIAVFFGVFPISWSISGSLDTPVTVLKLIVYPHDPLMPLPEFV